MAIKNKATLKANTNTVIKVNGNREITPPLDNGLRTDVIDSYPNVVDGGLIMQALLGYTTELVLSDRKHFAYKGYVDDSVTTASGLFLKLDGTTTMTGNINAGGFNLINLDTITDTSNSLAIGIDDRALLYPASAGQAATWLDITKGFGVNSLATPKYAYLKTTNLTADRTFEFPNTAGTLALISDVSAIVSDVAYAGSWNGVTTIAPSKNAVYDKIETLWKYDTNTVGSEKFIGTFDAYDLPIKTENIETARFGKDGYFNSLNGFRIAGDIVFKNNNSDGNIKIGVTAFDVSGAIGFGNVVIGDDACYTASSIYNVVAIGKGAFQSITNGNTNVGIGTNAGYNTSSGQRCLYFGETAGFYNETGSDQICIGRNAGPITGATALSGIIVFGSGAQVRQSNTATFGSNDTPVTKYVFGRGENECSTFPDIFLTVNSYPENVSNRSAGGVFGIVPSQARGTGIAGDLALYYSPPVASGTTLQTAVAALTVVGTSGEIIIENYIIDNSTNDVSIDPNARTLNDTSGNVVFGWGDGAYYLGESAVDGTWRFRVVTNDLVFERRESGVYVNKGMFAA